MKRMFLLMKRMFLLMKRSLLLMKQMFLLMKQMFLLMKRVSSTIQGVIGFSIMHPIYQYSSVSAKNPT